MIDIETLERVSRLTVQITELRAQLAIVTSQLENAMSYIEAGAGCEPDSEIDMQLVYQIDKTLTQIKVRPVAMVEGHCIGRDDVWIDCESGLINNYSCTRIVWPMLPNEGEVT